jgi:adenylate cyclase
MHRLVIAPGQSMTGAFELGLGITTIGRSEASGVQVQHESLSRAHAQIEVSPQGATIADLQSKNGTFLNQQRIERAAVKPGDVIRCGEVVFFFDPESVQNKVPPTITSPSMPRYSRQDVRDLLQEHPSGPNTALRIKPTDSAGRTKDKLQILLRVSQLLSAAESLEKLLGTVLDLVFEVFDVDRAAVVLADEKGDQLEVRAVKTSARVPAETRWQVSRRIVSYVRDQNMAALFADAQEDERIHPSASIANQAICAAMVAPLKPRDRLLGVLYVDSLSVPCRFGQEDLDFLTSFANQAAVAIENVQLSARVQQEAVLRNNLLRFFPPSAVHRLQAMEEIALDTVDAEVTALFCDISGFTAISEEMQPREVVGLLNDYFPAMADIIFKWDGTLEKYIGDAILAVWGAPFAHEDDPDRALAAAVEMQHKLAELNQRWAREKRRRLGIHIGINTGQVAAGNIGSERYIQYATIGDATNVAARICQIAGDGEIVISDRTRSALRRVYTNARELPAVAVKGKDQPLRLHQIDWQRTDAFPVPTEQALRPHA